MKRLAVFLLILGIGSLVLPMIGVQFRLMSLLAPAQPWAGILMCVVGAALLFAFREDK